MKVETEPVYRSILYRNRRVDYTLVIIELSVM